MLARKGLLALVLASRLLRALFSEDIMSLLSPDSTQRKGGACSPEGTSSV